MKIPVYSQEKADGLIEVIQANTSLSYLCPILITDDEPWLTESQLQFIKEEGLKIAKAAEESNFDLYHTKSILATSVWNENDDFLEKKQIWLARNTVANKRFNVEHDEKDIIGHMTGSFIIDDAGNLVADDTSIDELPEKIHIVDASVIYSYWRNEEDQKRIDGFIKDIKANKKFVSMEALFSDFAYAYIDEDNGEEGFIERNKSTSFLTKYLRAYGGKGKYEKYRLARMPLNFIFSGKGLVDNPAHKESTFLSSSVEFLSSSINLGYKNIVHNNGDNLMSKELEQKIKELEATQAQLKTDFDSKVMLAEKLQSDIEIYKTEASKLATENVELKSKIANEKRVNVFKTNGFELEEAVAMVNTLTKMSDEDFEQYTKLAFKKPVVAKNETVTAANAAANLATAMPVTSPVPALNPSTEPVETKLERAKNKLSKIIASKMNGGK